MQTPDQYFDAFADWPDHFSREIINEARQYYHACMVGGEVGKAEAAERAWSYARGASRFMQKPSA